MMARLKETLVEEAEEEGGGGQATNNKFSCPIHCVNDRVAVFNVLSH